MTPFEQGLIAWTGDAAIAAACAHAREQYPNESCGFVASEQYVACENKAKDPAKDFEIDDSRYDSAVTSGALKAVIHSHPNGPIFPSGNDMAHQLAVGVPYIILSVNETGVTHYTGFGDQLPKAPIIGRPFVHGIFDCYSVVRDVYALGKDELAKQGILWPLDPIKLPDCARDDDWWMSDDDLYQANFEKNGFRVISREEARPGDGFLMRLGDARANPKKKLNHAGVLLDKGMILHHLPTRASRREPAAIWHRAADIWLRHEEASP